MIATCNTCGNLFDGTEEDNNGPPEAIQCVRCYRKTRGMPPHPDYPDEDDDLPDTDLCYGDDPDLYIPD